MPEISVVMSVYNGLPSLRQTMDSVLSQEGIDFEFIVVNDGSTDGTQEILVEYANRDDRINVLSQQNLGLTRGLIAGCAQARGKYIARQDCGDLSLPSRLTRQRAILDAEPNVVMTSCGTRFVGPCDEELYTIAQVGEELEEGLRQLTIEKVRGHSNHGSTMFRRSAYEQVGGYRAAFRVAQDLDLWMRIAEVGHCYAIPEVLYRAKLTPGSISALRRDEQLRSAHSILACAAARRSGKSEGEYLNRWQMELTGSPGTARRRSAHSEHARFYYFIARLVRQSLPERSRLYYWKSIQASVLYGHAWVGLVRLMLR